MYPDTNSHSFYKLILHDIWDKVSVYYYYLQRKSQDSKFPISPIALTDHICWVFNAASVTNKYITWDDAVKYGFQFHMCNTLLNNK